MYSLVYWKINPVPWNYSLYMYQQQGKYDSTNSELAVEMACPRPQWKALCDDWLSWHILLSSSGIKLLLLLHLTGLTLRMIWHVILHYSICFTHSIQNNCLIIIHCRNIWVRKNSWIVANQVIPPYMTWFIKLVWYLFHCIVFAVLFCR